MPVVKVGAIYTSDHCLTRACYTAVSNSNTKCPRQAVSGHLCKLHQL